MIEWHLEIRNLTDLKGHPRNPRQLSKHDHEHLTKSLGKFGLIDKPIINLDNQIIGGHQRVRVLLDSGVLNAECHVPSRLLTEREVDELCIRLNKNTGAFDFDILANSWDVEDLIDWGFTDGELDIDLDAMELDGEEAEDDAGEPPKEPQCKLGDRIQLDGHVLMCGDSRQADIVSKLFGDEKVDMVLTDPPFGVNYEGKGKENNVKIENDNLDDYKAFFSEFISLIPWAEYNTFYCFMLGSEIHNLRMAMDDCGMKWADYLIWAKQHFVFGRKDYMCKHEFIAYGWKGKHKFYGPTNSCTVIEFDRPMKSKLHPTMKPIGLLEKLLIDGCKKKAIVYDPFSGSGSTLMACEAKGRVFRGIELSPAYCDVIIQRYLDHKKNAKVMINGNESWEARKDEEA